MERIADIKEHLEVIYRNRLESSLSSDARRYIIVLNFY